MLIVLSLMKRAHDEESVGWAPEKAVDERC